MSCNCDQAIALKAKARIMGLWAAYYRLRSCEPAGCETGKHGTNPGDAHRAWRRKFRRVQHLLALSIGRAAIEREAANLKALQFDSSPVLGVEQTLASHDAVAVVDQADGEEAGHSAKEITR